MRFFDRFATQAPRQRRTVYGSSSVAVGKGTAAGAQTSPPDTGTPTANEEHPASHGAEERHARLQLVVPKADQSGRAVAAPPPIAQIRVGGGPVTSISDLNEVLGGQPYGWLAGLVNDAMQGQLQVLDLRFGDCVIVGTAEALQSGHAAHVRNEISTRWWFRLLDVIEATPQCLTQLQLRQASTQSQEGFGLLRLDDRLLRTYEDIFRAAVNGSASDIHIRTIEAEGVASIALRINGKYKPWRTMSAKLALGALGAAFGKRVKENTAAKEHFNPVVPNSFMTTQTLGSRVWEGRADGRPHVSGYRMVIRLLESNPNPAAIPDLEQLGYGPGHLEIVEPALKRNYGIVYIFGSTGSGKSTTLRTFLVKRTDTEAQAVYSVEMPVEYIMPGVTQFSLPVDVTTSNEDLAHQFTALLRSTMRMDPDVLMVGEVRDAESASIAAEYTKTGHRVYTTAHGDGAVDGLSRLTDPRGELQMSAATLAGSRFLSASIYQRLVPLVCTKCRLPATDADHGLSASKQATLRDKFGLNPQTMFVANPKGCEACRPHVPGMEADGTAGVTAAVEILVPTPAIRAAIKDSDWVEVERVWRCSRTADFASPGMQGKTAFEHALYLASIGKVSILSVEQEFEPIESYAIYQCDHEGTA